MRYCSIETCDRKHLAKGYCKPHYRRFKVFGNTGSAKVPKRGLAPYDIYHTHWRMVNRCYDSRFNGYERYGGKGIGVCKGWRESVKTFYLDMGKRPKGLSLDRINSDLNYSCGKCPECKENGWKLNCRWANPAVQVWNRGKQKNNKSGYIGVSWSREMKKWHVQMGHKNTEGLPQRLRFGYFDDPEQAAIVYDMAVIFYRGEYGVTNIL